MKHHYRQQRVKSEAFLMTTVDMMRNEKRMTMTRKRRRRKRERTRRMKRSMKIWAKMIQQMIKLTRKSRLKLPQRRPLKPTQFISLILYLHHLPTIFLLQTRPFNILFAMLLFVRPRKYCII
ncbi:hypothetical protein BCR43DRAFT_482983 [Syncephalastrum racemosum]|uniref:Uncharacterized protein n=1 Tax=Syncephalastrum racemosum TaxID=13706 RepID=A0A1X2HUT1_SYNRA|nr:hypothetical protein BCR43DRAFT_482983 [Syncephalastrum racemosum]